MEVLEIFTNQPANHTGDTMAAKIVFEQYDGSSQKGFLPPPAKAGEMPSSDFAESNDSLGEALPRVRKHPYLGVMLANDLLPKDGYFKDVSDHMHFCSGGGNSETLEEYADGSGEGRDERGYGWRHTKKGAPPAAVCVAANCLRPPTVSVQPPLPLTFDCTKPTTFNPRHYDDQVYFRAPPTKKDKLHLRDFHVPPPSLMGLVYSLREEDNGFAGLLEAHPGTAAEARGVPEADAHLFQAARLYLLSEAERGRRESTPIVAQLYDDKTRVRRLPAYVQIEILRHLCVVKRPHGGERIDENLELRPLMTRYAVHYSRGVTACVPLADTYTWRQFCAQPSPALVYLGGLMEDSGPWTEKEKPEEAAYLSNFMIKRPAIDKRTH